jgi:hypothetical protein
VRQRAGCLPVFRHIHHQADDLQQAARHFLVDRFILGQQDAGAGIVFAQAEIGAPGCVLTLTSAGADLSSQTVNQKVLPSPTWLRTPKSPPIIRIKPC